MNTSSDTTMAVPLSDAKAVTKPLSVLATAGLFAVVALGILLPGLSRPKSMFFDEAYFVPEARALVEGTPNPSPYVSPLAKPPLGKVMMAIGMELAGDDAFGWRIAGAVCGALTVSAVYLWAYLLVQDAGLAMLAALLALLNSFLFVMSRIATVDVFLMFFLMWSLVAFTASLTLHASVATRRMLFCLAGVLIGLAGACKWNAIDTLGVYGLVCAGLLLLSWRPLPSLAAMGEFAQRVRQIGVQVLLTGLIVAPVLAYSLAFWPLCRLLHLPFTPREIASINVFMWHFNKTTAINPFISSPWYSWPLKLTPLRTLSYLVGNPVITLGGLAALLYCLRKLISQILLPEALVVLLFAANYLQWVVTPQKGLYYYYYYPCVMILGMAIVIAKRHLPVRIFGIHLSLLIVVAAAVVFVRCYAQMAHLDAPWDCALGCFP